jgi:hypothetical protein
LAAGSKTPIGNKKAFWPKKCYKTFFKEKNSFNRVQTFDNWTKAGPSFQV